MNAPGSEPMQGSDPNPLEGSGPEPIPMAVPEVEVQSLVYRLSSRV